MNKRLIVAALCAVFVFSYASAQRGGHASGGSHGGSNGAHSFGGSHSFGGGGGFHGFSQRSFGGGRSFSGGGQHGFSGTHSFGGFSGSHSFGEQRGFSSGHSFGGFSGSHSFSGTHTFGESSRSFNGHSFGGGFTPHASSHLGADNGFNFTGRRGSMREGFDRGRDRFGGGFVHRFGGEGFGPWGDHFRFGYWGWPGWVDADWFFGFWLFSPFDEPCVVSPWYGYPCLPPYIPESQVTVVEGTSADWDAGSTYNYEPEETPLSYGNHELNCAVGQIRNVFDSESTTAIDYLIPESGKVAIYNDGKYMYSLNGHQFRAMMIDNIHGTKTEGFQITDVREDGDTAIVRARHTFSDPEGGTDTIYQSYRLRREGERYEITDFSTSKDEHVEPF